MNKSAHIIKWLMWLYLLTGALIVLAIGFIILVLPQFSPEGAIPETSLSVMEKALLGWGFACLPLMIIGRRILLNKRVRDNGKGIDP